jgi:S-formylglutathione hydrolase FrmB
MRRLALLLALVAAGPAAATSPIKVTSSQKLTPRLTAFVLSTPAMNFPVGVRVLLPSNYASSRRRRYPVLYLLHGSFDDAASWTAKGDAEKLTAGLNLIVVMPATAGTGKAGGWASDWRNEGNGGPPMWETFTIRQLIPWIDHRYRTFANRSGRAVAGLSMGGFSSMSYAVRHPDLFVAASSYSGAVDTNNTKVQPVIEGETLADGGATPDAIWGPRATDEIYWRAHNPWDLAANLRGMTLAIRTGNGERGPYDDPGLTDPIEEGVWEMSHALHDRLDALTIPHVFDDYGPGTHSWPYWQRDLKTDLPRFMTAFAHPTAAPRPFTFLSADPSFSVYGWTVRMHRDVTEELAELADADARGFELHGSGTADVITAARYRRGSTHAVTIAGTTRQLRATRAGRLKLTVDLGEARSVRVTIA